MCIFPTAHSLPTPHPYPTRVNACVTQAETTKSRQPQRKRQRTLSLYIACAHACPGGPWCRGDVTEARGSRAVAVAALGAAREPSQRTTAVTEQDRRRRRRLGAARTWRPRRRDWLPSPHKPAVAVNVAAFGAAARVVTVSSGCQRGTPLTPSMLRGRKDMEAKATRLAAVTPQARCHDHRRGLGGSRRN